jgi:hypothetical protein
MDVLENYTTYRTYWRLLKTVEDDPRYDREKATRLLRSFVEAHEHAIRKKVEIIVEHFHDQVAHRIGQKAKAMVVTRSRLHAVRFALELRKYLKEKGYGLRDARGVLRDGARRGDLYTESQMNGLPRDADGEGVPAGREPVPGRGEQVPDRVRRAAPPHHVRGQEAGRGERRADALAAEPDAPGEAGDDGARLRERGRGHPGGVRPLLRGDDPLGGDRPEPPLRPVRRADGVPGVHAGRMWMRSPRRTSVRGAGPAAEPPRARRVERFRGLTEEEQDRLPEGASRLHAGVLVPLAAPDLHRCGAREALPLRAAAPAASPGPGKEELPVEIQRQIDIASHGGAPDPPGRASSSSGARAAGSEGREGTAAPKEESSSRCR